MDTKEWAELQEELLKAQLGIIRGHLRKVDPARERKSPQAKSMSHMSIVADILKAAGTALHATEIIQRAHDQYDIDLDRESLVSAMTKKVKRGVLFERTAPNTFTLKKDLP
jgi:hypothetical protein